MLKKAAFVLLSIFMLLGLQTTHVVACSGYYTQFSVEDLPEAELLVRATVIDTDDQGFNAVLRVEAYYKGEGPSLLTVMRYQPGLVSSVLVRGYDIGCARLSGQRFHQGDQGYFGLRSNGNGTYDDDVHGTAHFYPSDGKIVYQESFEGEKTITEEAFIEKMLEAGERDAPIQPTDEPAYYPLMRFLTFTTENGTRYQVNPDRSVTELPDNAPLATSPDGAHKAYRVDNETIKLDYTGSSAASFGKKDIPETIEYQYEMLKVPGHNAIFSSDSNLVAVWDQEHLSVYSLSNFGPTIYDGDGYGLNGNTPWRYLIAQVTISTGEDETLPHVLWSADGSTIVWEDSRGIWHWNIFNEADPTLLSVNVDDEDIRLMEVSTYGRYVHVSNGNTWWLHDTTTNESLPKVLVSPDERFLIVMQASEATGKRCVPPLHATCAKLEYKEALTVDTTFSYGLNRLGLTSCDADAETCLIRILSWQPFIGSGDSYISDLSETQIIGARQVIYDLQYDQPAVLVGDYSIYLGFYSEYAVEDPEQLDIVDVEDLVDSPIVSIAWGQPVFYDKYRMTTTTYLPQ